MVLQRQATVQSCSSCFNCFDFPKDQVIIWLNQTGLSVVTWPLLVVAAGKHIKPS